MKATILVAEDDRNLRRVLRAVLGRGGDDGRGGGRDPVRGVRLHLEAVRRGGTPACRGKRRQDVGRDREGGDRRRRGKRLVRDGGSRTGMAGNPQGDREGGRLPAPGDGDRGGGGGGRGAWAVGHTG